MHYILLHFVFTIILLIMYNDHPQFTDKDKSLSRDLESTLMNLWWSWGVVKREVQEADGSDLKARVFVSYVI